MASTAANMLVFRPAGQTLPGARLRAELLQELRSTSFLHGEGLRNILVSILLRAGEIECALADLPHPEHAKAVQVTDLLSQALLDPPLSAIPIRQAEKLLLEMECAATLSVTPPEGFCYYALHPQDYADAIRTLGLGRNPLAVIGIRSIGSTLSAVVKAATEKVYFHALPVERITVRPQGHPYDRICQFDAAQQAFIRRNLHHGADFLIVDEGPGLSGSSFLSVAEAMVVQGVPASRIRTLGSREVEPGSLGAKDAVSRWSKFAHLTVKGHTRVPAKARKPIHGGDWRDDVFHHERYANTPYGDPRQWPAVWAHMCAPRLLSSDGSMFYKFEGLGRYGAAVRTRAALIGEAEFGPSANEAGDGFTCYPMLRGRLLSHHDISESLLERMANYIAFRSQIAAVPQVSSRALEEMTRHNHQQLTGKLLDNLKLEIERPVIADARMMPHEFLRISGEGRIVKLDAAAHGDNHFFPGPVDIAWDLAGAIVEWDLQADAATFFLGAYQQASGDSAHGRLLDYLIAYCAFQGGYAIMAAGAMAGDSEQKLLLRDAMRYRAALLKFAAQRPRHAQVA